MQCARITISSMKKFAMNRSTAQFSLGAGAVVVLAVILETALSNALAASFANSSGVEIVVGVLAAVGARIGRGRAA